MKVTELTINNQKYKVLIAESQEDKANGLKGVKKLPENKGMLFVWDKPQKVSMTMQDTIIPLDQIFIDEDGEVLKIVHRIDTEQDLLESCDNTKWVLELNINSNVEEGDYVEGLIEEDQNDEYKFPVMKILDSKGDVQYELEGGERIFSRISTKKIIKWAKRAYLSHNDIDYKRLGNTVIKELHAQDNRKPEYVEAPK